MPALTSRLYRRAGPIALTPPRPDLPSFDPPDRRIRPRRPNRSSSLESSDESNELVSVSDESLVSDGSRLAADLRSSSYVPRRVTHPYRRSSHPVSHRANPACPAPGLPRRTATRTRCRRTPIPSLRLSRRVASGRIRAPGTRAWTRRGASFRSPVPAPPSRVTGPARIDRTCTRTPTPSQAAFVASSAAATGATFLYKKHDVILIARTRIKINLPYDTVISSPRSMCLSEYSVTRSSLTDTAALGRQLWLHVLTRASSRAA